MFSRIFARPRVEAPTIQGMRHREATSSARPSSARRRCNPMIERMYFASRSPRLALTCSCSSSNSRPIASICSGVRRCSGLSGSSSIVTRPLVSWPLWVAFAISGGPPCVRGRLLEVNLDRAFGRADTGPDDLALLPVDLAAAQIAHPARAQLAHARVADALAASERQIEALLLAGHEDGLVAVGLGLAFGDQELDRATFAGAVLT